MRRGPISRLDALLLGKEGKRCCPFTVRAKQYPCLAQLVRRTENAQGEEVSRGRDQALVETMRCLGNLDYEGEKHSIESLSSVPPRAFNVARTLRRDCSWSLAGAVSRRGPLSHDLLDQVHHWIQNSTFVDIVLTWCIRRYAGHGPQSVSTKDQWGMTGDLLSTPLGLAH